MLCCVWICLASVDFVWCRRLVANFVTLWDIGNSAHSGLSRSAASVPLASPSVGRVVRAQPRGVRIPFIYTANSSLQPPPSSTVMCSPVADSRTVHRPWTCDCALVFSRTRLWHLRVPVEPNFCGACVHIRLLIPSNHNYKVTLIYLWYVKVLILCNSYTDHFHISL